MNIRKWFHQAKMIAELRSENSQLWELIHGMGEDNKALEERNKKLSGEVEFGIGRAADLKREISELNDEITAMTKVEDEQRKTISFLKDTVSEKSEKLRQAGQTIESQNATIADLTDRNWWLRDRMAAVEAREERKQDDRVAEAMSQEKPTEEAEEPKKDKSFDEGVDNLLAFDPMKALKERGGGES